MRHPLPDPPGHQPVSAPLQELLHVKASVPDPLDHPHSPIDPPQVFLTPRASTDSISNAPSPSKGGSKETGGPPPGLHVYLAW